MAKSSTPLPDLVKAFAEIDTSGKVSTQQFVDAIAKTFPFFDHLGEPSAWVSALYLCAVQAPQHQYVNAS